LSAVATEWATPILHADLDAFYASVEILRDPSLKGKPVVVGGTSHRGVVTSASYEARAFGVRSAMPTSRARRMCPNAIFIQPDFDAYTVYSQRVRRVFRAFSPVIEPLSLDEAFIDGSGAARLWNNPETMAKTLRHEVTDQTGLTVSVGVAANKFLAKLASAKAKPDGLNIIDPSHQLEFLHSLPVEDLWGVGEQTAAVLKRLGLKKVGDIAALPPSTMQRALGSAGSAIARLAEGRDERRVVPDAPRKSVGAEETYPRDLVAEEQTHHALLALCDRVASRLRYEGTSGQTVTLKVRFTNFATITRSRTLPRETDAVTSIYQVARDLLGEAVGRRRVRLLGVSMSNLKEWPACEQLSLEPRPSWQDADRAVDQIRFRFGNDALKLGALLDDAVVSRR
jgi:DNA polymerase-4